MREMSLEMAALLKSKTMIGDNRPTHRILLGQGTRDFINPLVTETVVKKILGKDGESGRSISNPCPTTDGRFAFAWTKADNKIYIGYDSNESFFYNHYTFDDVIDSGIQVVDFKNQHTSLFRRDDGKILLFVNDKGNISVKVYISNSGNCDDFAYYSTILDVEIASSNNLLALCTINVPLEIDIDGNKRLIVTFGSGYRYDSTTNWPRVYGYYSDNGGLNWNLSFYRSRLNWAHHVGQIAQTNDGVLFFEETDKSGTVNVYASYNNGTSFSSLGTYYQGVSGAWGTASYYTSLYYDKAANVMYRISAAVSGSYIWKLDNPTSNRMPEFSNWQQYAYVDSNEETAVQIVELPSKNIAISWCDGPSRTIILGIKYIRKSLQAKRIVTQRQKGMAGGLTIDFDNKIGILAPDGEINEHLLWPNKEIIVEQGYGQELLQTFKGTIDSISMQADGQQADISISARDSLKRALDQTITASLGEEEVHVITALDTTVEALWIDLATMAGLTIGTVEETGITLSEKLFSWETYGDAFSFLEELVGFETVCDWDGVVHFRRDGRPEEIEVAYTFREGVDIIQIGYEINDKDLYRQVVVHGKKTIVVDEKEVDEVIEVKKDVPNADYYNILPHKILKIDASDADTIAKCEIIADKAIYLMTTRARIVQFQSIGIPHLERGDFIQVIESSTTISEIYRITDITTIQTSESYTMDITCYHHGAPEEVGE